MGQQFQAMNARFPDLTDGRNGVPLGAQLGKFVLSQPQYPAKLLQTVPVGVHADSYMHVGAARSR